MNNMAAPAIGALITSFFYNGPSSLVAAFPNVFAGKVPQVTVCLAATVVHFLAFLILVLITH